MTETRETEIRSVVWQKPGNPFAIVRTTDRQYESWKGPIGEDVAPGTWLRAEGYAGQAEGRWPAPFVVTKVLQIEGVRADVGKAWMEWRLPEIGEVRAERLSEQFGRGLADLLDSSAEARRVLSSIPGLTPKRVDAIQDAYAQFPSELRTALWLAEPDPDNYEGAGMGWPAIKLLIEEFNKRDGMRALRELAERDPYELMAVDGITFKTADSLAEGLGLEENDPRRLRGMVWEKLEDVAGGQGDCFLPRQEVMTRMMKFGYTEAELEKIFGVSPHFQLNALGVQLTRIRQAEELVAERVLHMLNKESGQQDLPQLDLPEWLDDSQRSAVENLMTVPLAILTGGPGTGKTTVLKTALDNIERKGERVLLASPTGKAAKRMTETTGRPAKTVHKLLEWKPEGFDRDSTNPIDADVVVVDEASMLDIELASSLFSAIGSGTRLILVGDANQLPPVGPGQPLLDLLGFSNVPTFRLTKTHRQQADSWVIDNAQRILHGSAPSLKDQSDFRFVPTGNSEEIVRSAIALYRQARSEGPEAEKQLQVLTPEHKKGAGTQVLNAEVQKALNPNASDSRFASDYVQGSGESKIYVGDKVLYSKNNPEVGLVNGSMGVVQLIRVTSDRRAVLVRFEGDVNGSQNLEESLQLLGYSEDEVAPFLSNNELRDLFLLEDDFIRPLQLAYAMTVHKAQGSEWKNVVVVADEAHWSMRRKLLYTAITRTSRMLTIIGTERAVARGAKNNPDENRATLLKQRLQGEL